MTQNPFGSRRGSAAPILCLLALLACAACDDNSPTEPVEEEVTEEVERVTETVRAGFGLGGAVSHHFVATNAGLADVSLVSLSPLDTLTVGLGFGASTESAEGSDPTCTHVAEDTSVRLGEVLQASIDEPGNYCVSVFDVGNVFPDETVEYELSITHP